MSNIEHLPGLTLSLQSATREKTRGTLVFTVAVPDDASVWSAVVKRLNGHRVYTGPNLVQEALEAVESDYKLQLRERDDKLEKQRNELERLRAALSRCGGEPTY